MANCIILRKVPYRLPGTDRLVWGFILAERAGLSLLFVEKPDDKRSHTLTVATENVRERIFEEVNTSRFNLEQSDLAGIGTKLQIIGENLCSDDFRRYFNLE